MRKVFFNNFTFDRGLVSKMYSETQETIKKKTQIIQLSVGYKNSVMPHPHCIPMAWESLNRVLFHEPAICHTQSSWTFTCGFVLELKCFWLGNILMFSFLILHGLFKMNFMNTNTCMQYLCAYLNVILLWNNFRFTKEFQEPKRVPAFIY